jgi:hypothetical protein
MTAGRALMLCAVLAGCDAGPGGEGTDSSSSSSDDTEPSPDYGDCPAYLACANALGEPSATIEAQYGEDGTCWHGTDDDRTLCRAECTDALELLSEANRGEPACRLPDQGTGGCSNPPVGTGYAVGDVSYDFTLEDAHGDPVSLYDACDNAVILWFELPNDSGLEAGADTVAGWKRDHENDGLTVLGVVFGVESASVVADIARELDIDFPLLFDPVGEVVWSYVDSNSVTVPFYVLLSPGARIETLDEPPTESQIRSALP